MDGYFVEGEVQYRGPTVRVQLRLCRGQYIVDTYKQDFPARHYSSRRLDDSIRDLVGFSFGGHPPPLEFRI